MIELNEISKSYQEASATRTILRQLSLTVDQGEFVSVTGPSGSGKSTLLHIMGGIDRADSGQVHVAGQEIGGLSERALALFRRRHIGFVFQFFHLIPTLSVAENIRLPLALLGRKADTDEVEHHLERVGLVGRSDTFPDVLSGGEQQRVAIVRATIHRPSLLLADEPTGNLDQASGQSILSLLKDTADSGTTVVMATHSERAAACASRRLQMENGRVATDADSAWG